MELEGLNLKKIKLKLLITLHTAESIGKYHTDIYFLFSQIDPLPLFGNESGILQININGVGHWRYDENKAKEG